LESRSFTSLKRSLSANDVKLLPVVSTGPPASKQQQRLRQLFNNRFYSRNDPRRSSSRKAIATAYWQDGSLDDAKTEEAFIFIKLLEASQARRYTQLQGKPRKNLHLAGGGIEIQVLGKISSIPLFPRQQKQQTTNNSNCTPIDARCQKKTPRPILPAPPVAPHSQILNNHMLLARPPSLRLASFSYSKTDQAAVYSSTTSHSHRNFTSSVSEDKPQDLSRRGHC
jgi:hypothetical protein